MANPPAPITVVAVTPIKRAYPHVGEIKEWPQRQTSRLLWDRVHDLEERLQAATATIQQLVSTTNAATVQLASVTQDAQTALALVQQPGGASGSLPGSGGGGETLPGGGDGGGGQEGCAAAGATGHDSGGLLTPVRAGQIVCGTGNEFSALKNATATEAERDANAEELILRMIWHLKEAGFTAGRQKNPSGALSKDKLCVVVDGVLRAYDVFVGKGNFAVAMTTQMSELGFQQMVDTAGTPD